MNRTLPLGLLLMTLFSCNDSGSAKSQAADMSLGVEVQLVENMGLLTNDADSPLSVKGTVKVQHADDNTLVQISDGYDDCDVSVQEVEPFDKSLWNIIVIQSDAFYTGTSATCERTLTVTRMSDGQTLSRILRFDLTGEGTTEVKAGSSADDSGGGTEPDDPSPTDPDGSTSKMCMGSATPCSLRIGMGSCWTGGCYWSSATSTCSGFVTACHTITSESTCLIIGGCLWQ